MTRYNKVKARPAAAGPLRTEAVPSGRTFEGGAGYSRAAETELFLRASSSLANQGSFYENTFARDARLAELARQLAVTADGWRFLQGFVPWLRKSGFMRTAPMLIAAEAVHERLARKLAGGNRRLIDGALGRPDEAGEFLAYWRERFGRRVPMAVQRGVGDAAIRMYNEYSLLKWDTESHGFRFGDVLEVTHAGDRKRSAQKLKGPWQHELFKYAIDRRHGNSDAMEISSLRVIAANQRLRSASYKTPELLLDTEKLRLAGMTWEDAQSLAGQHKLDKAKVWEAIIPLMPVFALLRNLRNFDQAGVSDQVASQVTRKLTDADAMNGIFPFQILAAHRNTPSLRWAYPLEQALQASLAGIPYLPGRTLILADMSTSMDSTFSKDGSMKRWDAAALYAVAVGQRCESADVVAFSSNQRYYTDPPGGRHKVFPLTRGESLLKSMERWNSGGFFLGGGTDTTLALKATFAGHDRVIVVTDDEASRNGGEVSAAIPQSVPMYTVSLVGYQHGAAGTGPNRHLLSGLTDATFSLIPILESKKDARWPWELSAEETMTRHAQERYGPALHTLREYE